MRSAQNSQSLSFRLVLIDSSSMRLLTIRHSNDISLPRESLRYGVRLAQALTEAIRRRFDLAAIQLAVLPKSTLASRCAVFEILELPVVSRSPVSFEQFESIPASEITDDERSTVGRIMTGQEVALGRFGRLGWIDDFGNRICLNVDRNSIRQLNQGVDFCLMTFRDARGVSLWFKAVGEPNVREFAITDALARQFPAFVPRIVASIPEWSGWITEHVEGTPLDNSLSLNGWTKVLKALVSLQEHAVRSTSSLSAAGAIDCSCAHLRSTLSPFLEEMRRAMHAQTSTAVSPLSDDELVRMQAQIAAAITILEDSGIPDSLLHRDIGHGNVIVSRTGATFLDWAEAGIGHPFISAEHLLASHECLHPLGGAERQALRNFYAGLWQAHLGHAGLELAAKAAPAVAALAYGVDTWQSNAAKPDPEHIWPFLRSILRRTKRELDVVAESV